MTKTTLLAALAAAALLGACAPIVSSVPTNPAARTGTAPGMAARPPSSVRLYIGGAPTCAYEELALIEGSSRLSSMSRTVEKMRAEAAKYGADGLVLLTHQDTRGNHESTGTGNHNYLGVAISFTRSVCAPTARKKPGTTLSSVRPGS